MGNKVVERERVSEERGEEGRSGGKNLENNGDRKRNRYTKILGKYST